MNEQETLRESFNRIRDFIQSKPFQALLEELYEKPRGGDRREFVNTVILDDGALAQRNVQVPEGLAIQRSAFKDKRPTLFCVTEEMPGDCHWEKTTFTFDDETPAALNA